MAFSVRYRGILGVTCWTYCEDTVSRSRKHTPISGNTTSESEKEDKRLGNRRLRRRVKVKLVKGEEDVADTLDAVYDDWNASKDGKHWFGDSPEAGKWIRK